MDDPRQRQMGTSDREDGCPSGDSVARPLHDDEVRRGERRHIALAIALAPAHDVVASEYTRLHHFSVYPDAGQPAEITEIHSIELGYRPQNTWVTREIRLRESRVHAARARNGHAQ